MERGLKTWICLVFGGGTPLYLVSARDEKRAWELIKSATFEKYHTSLPKNNYGGLIKVHEWHTDTEMIKDVHDLYSKNGNVITGSFNGF